MQITPHFDRQRRFGGIARLYGQSGLERLLASHVCVVGIGGVGSWTAEALGRSGVGSLTLIDLDHVAESNTNRQIHALDATFGQAKVDAMRDRLIAIHPEVQVNTIDDFLTPENVGTLIGPHLHAVVDCTDNVRAKAALVAWCIAGNIPIVTCGAAGGKTDPAALRLADLSQTIQDPLLAKVRQRLRKEHGFARKGKMKVAAVYSEEMMRRPAAACDVSGASGPTDGQPEEDQEASNFTDGGPGPQGLNCAGFGSVVTVTASMGLAAAAYCLRRLTGEA